jgi:hypothetical protein
MSREVPAGNFSSRGGGCAGAGTAAGDSGGWTGFVADSGALADWAARPEQRKMIVKSPDIELLMRLTLLMNRVVVYERAIAVPRRREGIAAKTKMRGSNATHSMVKGISILLTEVYPALLRD